MVAMINVMTTWLVMGSPHYIPLLMCLRGVSK